MRTVNAIHFSPSAINRWHTQFRGKCRLIPHASVSEFMDSPTRTMSGIILLEISERTQDVLLPGIRMLRAELPRLPLIGYIEFAAQNVTHLVDAVHVGLTEVIIAPFESRWDSMQALFDKTQAHMIVELLRSELMHIPHGIARTFCQECFARARQPLSVGKIAELMHVRRQQINLALREAKLPSAEWFVTNARLLLALRLLSEHDRSISSISHSMQYTDEKSLRRSLVTVISDECLQRGFAHAFDDQLAQVRAMFAGARQTLVPVAPFAYTESRTLVTSC